MRVFKKYKSRKELQRQINILTAENKLLNKSLAECIEKAAVTVDRCRVEPLEGYVTLSNESRAPIDARQLILDKVIVPQLKKRLIIKNENVKNGVIVTGTVYVMKGEPNVG